MTRQVFYHELEVLRERMVSMGSMVDKAIARAMDALTRQDLILARDIIQNDASINDYRWATEDEAFQIIATQAPLAGDLRVIMAVLSIATDLERMADHCVGIAKTVIDTADEPPLRHLDTLKQMSNIGREMLSDSLTAFIQGDVEAAKAIIERDDELDNLYKQVYAELLTFMLADPTLIDRATRLLWVGHNLERIGDRVTNICERVLYGVSGKVDLAAYP
jgi:phosphate transport system protein